MSGLAVASCFPAAVTAAANGNPLYFLLGGIASLLPDVVDARLVRHLHKHDAQVISDPLSPDPQIIADAIAEAIDRTARRQHPLRLQLHGIRLARDRWQGFRLRFNPRSREISVKLTTIIRRNGRPAHDNHVQPTQNAATAEFETPLRLDHTATMDVADGTLLSFRPSDDGGLVTAGFAPWKRQFSHSLLLAAVVTLLAGILWNPLAAAIVCGASAAHLLLDQLGAMGCNLLWPLRRQRAPGLMLLHPAQRLPNLAITWLAALLIYSNLARQRVPPLESAFTSVQMLVFGTGGLIGLIGLIRNRRKWA